MKDFMASSGWSMAPDPASLKYIESSWIAEPHIAPWVSAITSIFDRAGGVIGVRSGFVVRRSGSSLLFEKEGYERFTLWAQKVAAERFCVIEDDLSPSLYEIRGLHCLRYGFEVGADWEWLTNSCDAAIDLFQRPIRQFFVVTDNGMLGKYCDNDSENSFELLALKKSV